MAMGGTVARLRAEFLLDLGEYRKGLKTAESEGAAAATSIRQKMADAFGKAYKTTGTGLGTVRTEELRLYQRQFAALKVGATGIGSALASALKAAPVNLFNSAVNKTKSVLGGMLNTLKQLPGTIAKGFALGIGFTGLQMLEQGIARIVHAIPDLINSGKAYGQVVADVTQVTGVSGERASEFVGVLKLMGAPLQNIVQLLAQYQRNLQTPAVKKAFAEIGISIYDMNGNVKDAIALLNEGRAAIEKLGIGSVTIGNIQRAFGRGGIKVFDDYIRMSAGDMDKLIKKVHDMGLVMSSAQAQLAENMNWTMNQWNLTITGIGVGLFQELAPMINSLLSALSDWVSNNRQKIVDFFASIASSVIGFVAGLFDANLALQSFADSLDSVVKTQSPALATLMGRQNDVAALEAQVAEEKLKGAGSSKAATSAIEAQTKALDKQAKALTELDARQEKVYRRALEGITKQLDAELKLMDAEEKRRGLADKDAQLMENLREARERLNDAQIALAAAQAGDRGKVDADAVAAQMQAVVDAQRKIADAQKDISDEALDRISENRRAQIEAVKDYIAGLDKLVEDAMSKASALKTLGGREASLADALKAAQASGDTVAAGDIKAKLDAVRAVEKRVNQQIANEKKQDTIAALKEQLAQERSLISSSTQTTSQIRLAAAKKLLAVAEKNFKAEQAWTKVTDEMYQKWGVTIGGAEKTSLPTRFKQMADAGAAAAKTIKDVFKGIGDVIQGIIDPNGPLAKFAVMLANTAREITTIADFANGKITMPSIRDILGPDLADWLGYTQKHPNSPTLNNPFTVPESGKATGGIVGTKGPERATLGEKGAEWVINAPALRALASLNRAPMQTIAAVAGGGGVGGQPAIIRLEIGGRPLLDYMDENLVYRRRI